MRRLGWVVVVGCSSPPAPAVIGNVTPPPVTGSLFPASFTDCTRERWCRFADPLPVRASGIWVGAEGLYAGGHIPADEPDEGGGAIARWNGREWKLWKLAGAAYFSIDGVVDGRRDRVYASGRNTPLLYLDGGEWKSHDAEDIFHDVTIVGAGLTNTFLAINGNILRRDPRDAQSQWHSAHDPTSTSVFDNAVYDLDVDPSGNAWAIVRLKDEETRAYRWHRERDRFEPFDVHRKVYRISARSPEDVVVAGVDGVFRWNGRVWRDLALPPSGYTDVVHRGTDVVLLHSPDKHDRATVTIVDRAGRATHMEIPDDPSELAVGLDGSLWAASSDRDAIWFQRPTSGSARSDASR